MFEQMLRSFAVYRHQPFIRRSVTVRFLWIAAVVQRDS